ncbi:MAG: phosphopyruvate hydratase [Clostridia bacterium]|nr:phosphopyruvate hydratase [Clostridia bacterium]
MIVDVKGMEVLDSRGNPTVAAEVTLKDGIRALAISPSGASTGKFEAVELRDGGERYNGKGVTKAVNNINSVIAPALRSMGTLNQRIIDTELCRLDGTDNKGHLGANAMLAVSMAVARAAARHFRVPLYRYLGGISGLAMPTPMMNILNGGAHSSNNIDIQEFMIVPRVGSFSENLRAGAEIYHALGIVLKAYGKSTGVGDEGGFAPDLKDDREAIELIIKGISSAGYSTENVKLALDVASSEWYSNGVYDLPKSKQVLTSEQLIEKINSLAADYPIISVEDGLGEDDNSGWKIMTERLGGRMMLVGDDLFVTNPKRLKDGIKEGIANAVLVKLNQIGTLSETLEVINIAKRNGYTPIISHRSGETEDTFIADLSVAVGAGYIKSGAPCRTDRTAKYNRLLKIESEIL